eukprot:403361121
MSKQTLNVKEIDVKNLPPIDISKSKIDINNLPPLPSHITYQVAKAPPVNMKGKKDLTPEQEDFKDRKEFSLKKSEYDLETYWGRFQHQFTRINPSLFFVSKKTIKECQEKIEKFKIREEAADNIGAKVYLKPDEIKEHIYANRVVGSAVHPDTKQIQDPYLRLSGFVIFNVPIVFFVLFTRQQTPMFNAGMQWINQTYNALMNYGNRNASSTYTTYDLAKGYSGAVAASVLIALYSRTMMGPTLKRLSGSKLILANSALNYLAAAFAGAANLALMRSKEMRDGIQVQNKEGTETYGTSKVAAKQAISQTAFSRFVLPLPVLFFPAIANYALEKMHLWPKGRVASKTLELLFCTMSLTVALPLSVAMFKQRGMINYDEIEEELKEIKNAKGEQVREFYFNKGL